MSRTRGGWLFTLRVKLVAVLIPLTVLSMLVAMVELGKFLHEFLSAPAELETAQLGRAVELALRQSMLRKPDLALGETLADVEKTPGVRRVWVIDKNGRVAHAADRAMIGRALDKKKDSVCNACHTDVRARRTEVRPPDARPRSLQDHQRPVGASRGG